MEDGRSNPNSPMAMCMVPSCVTQCRSMFTMTWWILKCCLTIISNKLKFLMLYLYKWKQVAYDCQCGHMRPWAPHLRLPLTKLVREEIHKRQASKQCEMVKKTVKKDPATGTQKTQTSKSQWYKLKFKCVSILFNAFDLAVNLTRHLGQVGPTCVLQLLIHCNSGGLLQKNISKLWILDCSQWLTKNSQ